MLQRVSFGERNTKGIIENGLGAAYQLHKSKMVNLLCIGYDGNALYSVRV